MIYFRCRRLSLISLLLVWLAAYTAVEAVETEVASTENSAGPAASASALEAKLRLIARLVEGEVEGIEASGNREALAHLQAARRLRKKAIEARSHSDTALADVVANEALRELGHALRISRAHQVDTVDWRTRYDEMHARMVSFHQAYTRIMSERSRARGGVLDEAGLNALTLKAEKLLHEGNYRAGVAALSHAVSKVEAALMQLRDKETLVHELKFDTAEEEYAYERSRNQSYEMLIEMALTQDKIVKVSPEVGSAAMLENRAARERADTSFDKGNAKAGILVLEAATSRLIQVLRAGGLPHP